MIKNKGKIRKIREARNENEKKELQRIEERLIAEAPVRGVCIL